MTRSRVFWTLPAVGLPLMTLALDDRWIYAWSRDPSPRWAQLAVVYAGLVGVFTLLHAMIVTQEATMTTGTVNEDRERFRAVYQRALGFTGVGALVGTLIALISVADLPANIKATGLISDLALVGGVAALAVAAPINVWTTWTTVFRLWPTYPRRMFRILTILAATDLILVTGLATFVPNVMVASLVTMLL